MGWLYGIVMGGIAAAVGIPMAKAYVDSLEVAGDCLREGVRSYSDECLREMQNRLQSQVMVSKAVVSVLPGAPSVPEKKAEQ
jgi:hypothetical protein